MILKNGQVFLDGQFVRTDVEVKNGIIAKLGTLDGSDEIDCADRFLIPGLVDIHTHGCVGYDFSTASTFEMNSMLRYYGENGITSILATTVTLSDNDIQKAVDRITEASENDHDGAVIRGINLEGPYLSPKKCGAHDISLLKEPDLPFIQSLGNFIKVVNVAPEYQNAASFIDGFCGKVSIAHTDCDYDTAIEAIRNGADHITHIFNAMNGLHHRKPGVIGAFFDSDAIAEIICDGIHIAPPVLRMMFGAKAERLAVISDSMAATGLGDGEYTLGNLKVFVKDSVATLKDGTIAGSTMNVFRMMQNLIQCGIPPEKAIASATHIPADSVGLGDACGHIAEGRDADLVLLSRDFSLERVLIRGRFL